VKAVASSRTKVRYRMSLPLVVKSRVQHWPQFSSVAQIDRGEMVLHLAYVHHTTDEKHNHDDCCDNVDDGNEAGDNGPHIDKAILFPVIL